jgi:hypothetical protein
LRKSCPISCAKPKKEKHRKENKSHNREAKEVKSISRKDKKDKSEKEEETSTNQCRIESLDGFRSQMSAKRTFRSPERVE